MKEENKLKLMNIATILTQIDNGGIKYNGSDDVVMAKVSVLNNLGQKIIDIIQNELKSQKKK